MTRIIDTTSKRRRSAKLAAGFAISAILALGTFAGPATRVAYTTTITAGIIALRQWSMARAMAGYYGSPYYGGSPYYYAPPVVYGPGIGISLPFVGINIR